MRLVAKDASEIFSYRLRIIRHDGNEQELVDPYSFLADTHRV